MGAYYKEWHNSVADIDMTSQASETLYELYDKAQENCGMSRSEVDERIEEYYSQDGDILDADMIADWLHNESVEDIAVELDIKLLTDEDDNDGE